MVCDPVLLYKGDSLRFPVKKIRKRYLLVYSYDRHMIEESEVAAIRTYARKHRLITVSCGTYHRWCDRNIVCNAEEWYSYFRDAFCVLTDTFHGTIAAIRNHCNVAVYIRESINAYKLQSLLEEVDLGERILPQITAENMERVFTDRIDYRAVEKRIQGMRRHSEAYLLAALNGVRR